MTDDRDAQRAARRAETEAMVEAEAAKAKEVLTKRAKQKAQAVTTEVIMRLIVAQVNGLVEKTAEELAHSKGADAPTGAGKLTRAPAEKARAQPFSTAPWITGRARGGEMGGRLFPQRARRPFVPNKGDEAS